MYLPTLSAPLSGSDFRMWWKCFALSLGGVFQDRRKSSAYRAGQHILISNFFVMVVLIKKKWMNAGKEVLNLLWKGSTGQQRLWLSSKGPWDFLCAAVSVTDSLRTQVTKEYQWWAERCCQLPLAKEYSIGLQESKFDGIFKSHWGVTVCIHLLWW